MPGPVAWGVGIVAASVVLGGVSTARSVVENSAYTGGATGGVILGGLDDLFAGFQAGSGSDKTGNQTTNLKIGQNSGFATQKTPAAPRRNQQVNNHPRNN